MVDEQLDCSTVIVDRTVLFSNALQCSYDDLRTTLTVNIELQYLISLFLLVAQIHMQL